MSPKLVRICRMWRIFNHKKNNQYLGTSFLCIDIKTNIIPDVVGQIRMFQGNDLKNPRATTEAHFLKTTKILVNCLHIIHRHVICLWLHITGCWSRFPPTSDTRFTNKWLKAERRSGNRHPRFHLSLSYRLNHQIRTLTWCFQWILQSLLSPWPSSGSPPQIHALSSAGPVAYGSKPPTSA
ncbi:hypothetical protein YC2023_014945 [Brassica napus]